MTETRWGSRWWGLLLLLAALGLYLLGAAHGALAVLALAVVAELAGWIKLLINPRRRR